jgi:hypothetical protein
MAEQRTPTDPEIRVAIVQTLEQIYQHSLANTQALHDLRARVAGTEAVAAVVDDNETQVLIDRHVAATKDIISHLYEKSHQYVVVIVAGAFAAYLTTLGILADRFSDYELRLSALLMTVSLATFVLWEVINVSYIGVHVMQGDWGTIDRQPKWLRIGWPLAMFGSLTTALPAIGLSIFVYLRGLGAFG